MVFIQHDARTQADAAPCVPDGVRVYAVGDIHGRADLLVRLHRKIAADAAGAAGGRCIVVYVGDYVDRGPDTCGVIDELLGETLAGFERVFLKGNHEDFLTRFLADGSMGDVWFMNGGIETLESYGIDMAPWVWDAHGLESVQKLMHERMGPGHLEFFRTLELYRVIGDYIFVHAGLRPGVPLDRQDPRDFMWIRHEFLESRDSFGGIVVHGHTPFPEPEVRANRIGIDTKAWQSGHLTCLVLDGAERRFMQT